MDCILRWKSPLGDMMLAADGDALIGAWFDGQEHFGEGLSPEHEERSLPVLEEARRWLEVYFSGREPDFTPALRPRGTAFRQAVWAALREVPYGRTATYGEIARALAGRGDFPRANPRAVGGAIARNPISLIVPCHRVLGADGGLTGYAGGIDRKRKLLELEGAK